MQLDRFYLETLYNDFGQYFSVDKVLFQNKTEHQELIIFENASFGRIMALDGVIQTTEKDEFVYHEMLTHTPILAHGAAKRVLVIGGGDGGILREVLKHPQVEKAVLVEIDAQVVEMCKQYLPNHSQGAFDDPRVEVVISDGKEYVRTTEDSFDVIISDSTDPIGPGESLFESVFYQGCKRILTEGGVLVTQNGVCFHQLDEVSTTAKRLSPFFADRTFFSAAVPTYYGGIMTFAWASDNAALRQVSLATLQERAAQANLTTRYYTPAVHMASFALPQYVLDALED